MRLLVLTVAITALIAAPAAAAPAVDGVFDIPGTPGVSTNGQLTVGPDGNVWVALDTAVAKVTPDGTVTVFASADLNNTLAAPTGGITSANGFVWISQAPGGGKKALVKIPPASPATAEGVDVTGLTAGATAMTTGADGNVWLGIADKIIRFSPADPTVSTTFPMAGLSPKGMTSASDGTLWVTDTANGGRLVNVTAGGVATPVTVGGQPQFVGAGPNAQIAYGNPNSTPQQIGLLSPGGTPQTLDRPNGSDPFGVTFGADGAYWIAEFAGNRLARVTTDGQLTTLEGFPVVAGQGPRQIVAGPNNTLWATVDKPGDAPNSKIARITGVDPPPPPPPPPPVDQPPAQQPITVTPPPPPPPDKTPPAITSISIANARLKLTLSEPATLRVVLSRAAKGQRRGKRCVKPSPRRRAKRCSRYVRVRAFGTNGVADPNTIRLSPRKLARGRYRVVFTATDAAGNRSAQVTRTFRVTR